MKDQPVAKISIEQLEQLIKREFPENDVEVAKMFISINSESEAGRRRIGTAVLKLADRKVTKINQLIERANIDFRDIIAEAEYPRIFNIGFDELTEEEEQKAYTSDWNEYTIWLKGKEA